MVAAAWLWSELLFYTCRGRVVVCGTLLGGLRYGGLREGVLGMHPTHSMESLREMKALVATATAAAAAGGDMIVAFHDVP